MRWNMMQASVLQHNEIGRMILHRMLIPSLFVEDWNVSSRYRIQ